MTNTILYPAYTSSRKKPVNLRQADDALFRNEYEKAIPDCRLHRFRHVKVTSGGFIVKGLRLMRESIWTDAYFKAHRFRLPLKLLRNPSGRIKQPEGIERYALCHDHSWNGYFHWMTEVLCRIAAVEDRLDGSTALILPENLSEYQRRTLEAFRIPNVCYLAQDEYLKVPDLLMPSHPASPGNYNRKLLHRVISKLTAHFLAGTSAPSQRIYISRKKAEKRRVSNEAVIEDILKRRGYAIYCMEDHDFTEQMRISAATSVMISIHGAGLTNMMFMESGSAVLELRQEGEDHKNCYFTMASDLDLPYFYLPCSKTDPDEDNHTADIVVDPLKFEAALDSIERYQTS